MTLWKGWLLVTSNDRGSSSVTAAESPENMGLGFTQPWALEKVKKSDSGFKKIWTFLVSIRSVSGGV